MSPSLSSPPAPAPAPAPAPEPPRSALALALGVLGFGAGVAAPRCSDRAAACTAARTSGVKVSGAWSVEVAVSNTVPSPLSARLMAR